MLTKFIRFRALNALQNKLYLTDPPPTHTHTHTHTQTIVCLIMLFSGINLTHHISISPQMEEACSLQILTPTGEEPQPTNNTCEAGVDCSLGPLFTRTINDDNETVFWLLTFCDISGINFTDPDTFSGVVSCKTFCTYSATRELGTPQGLKSCPAF